MAVKSYVSNFTMHFGPATVRGTLTPIRATSKTPTIHYCTPDGQPVSQVYADDKGNIYARDQLSRATIDDQGNFTQIVQSVLDAAKESPLPLNVLNLTAHDAAEVERHLFPSANNAYIFQPIIKQNKKVINDPVNYQWHDFLNVTVRESGAVFVGVCNLRNYEGLFRLSHYQGYLVVQKQLYPEDLNQFEAINPQLEPNRKAKALSVVKALTEPFDPATYSNAAAARIQAAVETPFDADADAPVNPFVEPEIDMDSILDSFLN